MFFWQNKLSRQFLRIIDLFLICIGCFLAYIVESNCLGSFFGFSNCIVSYTELKLAQHYMLNCFFFLFYSHFTLNFFALYRTNRDQKKIKMFGRMVFAFLFSAILLVSTLYILHIQYVSRFLVILSIGFSLTLLYFRQLYTRYQFAKNSRDKSQRINVLIIGSRERAKETIRYLLNDKECAYNVIGCLETDNKHVGETVVGHVKIVDHLDNYKDVLLKYIVDEIFFSLPLQEVKGIQEYITYAEMAGVKIRIVPDWQIQQIMFTPEIATVKFDTVVGLPTLLISSTPSEELKLLIKNFIDYIGAACGLILLSPLFLFISVMIKLTSKGPVYFHQKRVGINGRPIQIHKFRTMVEDAEELQHKLEGKNEMDGPVFKMKDDPRITKIGYLLRKTSLDELPQLYNVLCGDMSLVGPRPPLPSEVQRYKPTERRRLSMKPGITCIWQVNERNNTTFDEWMKMDMQYIDNWSLLLDAKILVQTVRAVLRGTGQ